MSVRGCHWSWLLFTLGTLLTGCGQQDPVSVPAITQAASSNESQQIAPASIATPLKKNVPYHIERSQVRNAAFIVTSVDKQKERVDGQVQMKARPGELAFAFLMQDGTSTAMDFIAFGSKEALSFTAENSAKAFILSDVIFTGWSSEHKLGVYRLLNTDARLAGLVQTFARAKKIVDTAETITLAGDIAFDVALQYAQQVRGTSKTLTAQQVIKNFDYSFPFTWTATQTGRKVRVTGNSILAQNIVMVDKDDSRDPFTNPDAQVQFSGTPNAVTGFTPLDLLLNGTTEGQAVDLTLPLSSERKVYTVLLSATNPSLADTYKDPKFVNQLDVLMNFLNLLGLDLNSSTMDAKQINAARLLTQAMTNLVTTELFTDAVAQKNFSQIGQQLAVFFRQNTFLLSEMLGIDQDDYVDLVLKRLLPNLTVKAVTRPVQIAYTLAHLTAYIGATVKEKAGNYNTATVTFHPPAMILYNLPGAPVTPPTCTSGPVNVSRSYQLTIDGVAPDNNNVAIQTLRGFLNGTEIGLVSGGGTPVTLTKTMRLNPGTYTLKGEIVTNVASASDLKIVKEQTFIVPQVPLPPACEPEPDPVPEPSRDDGIGSSFGDPHLSTYESRVYSFQAAGEFVLTRSALPGDTFEVQARYLPLTDSMSANAAVAMRVIRDRVGLYATKSNTLIAKINGQAIALENGRLDRSLPFGGHVNVDGTTATVTWPDGSAVYVQLLTGTMGRVTVKTPANRRGQLLGLLGNFDGNPSNDFSLRTGLVLPENPTTEQIYQQFGESWRLTPEESLFDYEVDQDTYSFTNRSFPARYMTVASLEPSARETAEITCRNAGIVSNVILQKCILDVAITGNNDWALISAGVDPNIKGITLMPKSAVMLAGSTRNFGALVSGRLLNRRVTWQTQAGAVEILSSNTMQFQAPQVPGVYQIQATLAEDPSISQTLDIRVVEAATSVQGETRFILRWPEAPRDLDTHLWLPESTPYHLYYGRKGRDEVCPNATLDVDDTDGFGPEIVRVSSRIGKGQYQLLIHQFSSDGDFTGAEVEVTDSRGTATVVKNPSVAVPGGRWWHVLSMDAETGAIVLVNQVVDQYEPYFDTGIGCGINDGGGGGLLRSSSNTKPIWRQQQSNMK